MSEPKGEQLYSLCPLHQSRVKKTEATQPKGEPAKKTEAIEGKPIFVRDATAEELATLGEEVAKVGGEQEGISEREIEQREAEREAKLEEYREFEPGVKFITGEKRFDRAM